MAGPGRAAGGERGRRRGAGGPGPLAEGAAAAGRWAPGRAGPGAERRFCRAHGELRPPAVRGGGRRWAVGIPFGSAAREL